MSNNLDCISGCQHKTIANADPWIEGSWLTTEQIRQMDGRRVIGFYDLADEVTGEKYQVYFLFDSHMRGGSSLSFAPYQLIVFFTKNGREWNNAMIASGTRILNVSSVFDDETIVHLQLDPYFIAYSSFDHPLHEEAHRPIHAIFTMRDGKPTLDYLGS